MSLYLGLPQWSHPSWPGQLLGLGAKPAEHLAHYATVFNSVEGNTTFYALPTPDTVQRWADAVPDHFRFNFKFPQTISHQSDLVSAAGQVADFIRLLAPLHDKLGLLTLLLVATAVTVATDHVAFLLAQAAVDWAQKLPAVPITLMVKYDVSVEMGRWA